MKLIHIKVAESINNRLHVVTHFTYLCLVFIESHGLYGYAAGGIATVMVVGGGLHTLINKAEKDNG